MKNLSLNRNFFRRSLKVTAILSTIFAVQRAAPSARADNVLPAPAGSITIPFPAADAFSTSVRFGSNGLLYAWDGATVWQESAAGSSTFNSFGTVTTTGSDAGPLNFSQNGQTLLIGDGTGGVDPNANGLLFTLSASGPATQSTSTAVGTAPFNYDLLPVPAASAMPSSQNKFFVDCGSGITGTTSEVDVFDFATGADIPVVTGVPGASTSIALDSQNWLYVGVGYGSSQGQIERFSLAALDAAYKSNTPITWNASPAAIFNNDDSNNSGSGMFFDHRGLMFVGGPNGVSVLDAYGDNWFYSSGIATYPVVSYNATNDQFALIPYGANAQIFNASQFPSQTSAAWSQTASGGLWSNGGNWSGGNMAQGVGATADFSQLKLAGSATVHLDTPHAVGTLIFGDQGAKYNWTLDNSGVAANVLTLATTTGQPTIAVVNGTATINAVISTSQGFAKTGSGTLQIGAAPELGNGAAPSVSGGTLRFSLTSGSPIIGTGVTAAVSAGATLELAGSVSALNSSVNIANNSQAAGGGLYASGGSQSVGIVSGTGSTVVAAGASITAYQIVQSSLTIHGTGIASATAGRVTLVPSGSGSTANPTGPNNVNFSSTLSSLSIDSNGAPLGSRVYYGTLDIGNNGLVIAYGSGADPYASIDDMIRSGFDNAHWDGTGITSSLGRAAANSTAPLNIGLLDFTPGAGNYNNTTFIVFEGQTITTNAVLVRLTYMDDINLFGDVTFTHAADDALIFAANYGSGTTWSVGDLTHDGAINPNDALLFAANYAVGLPTLDGSTGNALAVGDLSAVPEPSAALLALLAAGALVVRRRKHEREM